MFLRFLVALALTLPSHACSEPPFPVKGTMRGVASVVDGDGIAIAGTEVRLQGLAAPEDRRGRVDPGGKEATAALQALVEGKPVVCFLDGTKTRGRPVGVCEYQGVDVATILVRDGFARDCPRFSKGRYADAEATARANGRDLSLIYELPKYCVSR